MDSQASWPDSTNLAYVEQLYELYLRDPGALSAQWRDYFRPWAEAHLNGNGNGQSNGSNGSSAPRVGPSFTPRSLFNPVGAGGSYAAVATDEQYDLQRLQHQVGKLVRNYRVRGHRAAAFDPLGQSREHMSELDPGYFGFTEADMDKPFLTSSIHGKATTRSLRTILAQLHNTYCRYIGAQFMHIDAIEVREWLQERMESSQNRIELSRKQQIRILTRLTDATIFEEFIQKKFIGAKSFSLEGAESLIPLLDLALEKAGEQGVREAVIGMAHRGRLNVLANIMGKSPARIFREFEDADPQLYLGGGDVKYHLGESGDWRTRTGKSIHLSLCFNPSHLEFVSPVVLGRLRAKQDRLVEDRKQNRPRGEKGLPILIHGDAAFIGEGVVQETLNMSGLAGYDVGGALHIVINNQIGFTTGVKSARTSTYCTDIAKMLQIPIFHVNGEQPEAVAQVVDLAMDFREQFGRDVVIDMYCFRKRGHNESDEPSYTQPKMYKAIREHKEVRESYLGHLMKMGGVSEHDADRIALRRTELLEQELTAARSEAYVPKKEAFGGVWEGFSGGKEDSKTDPDTAVPATRLSKLLEAQTHQPKGFKLHPKLKRWMAARREMAGGTRALDWAAAEALAFATLLTEGTRIRMSGQDAQRGTFSQRHTVLHDADDGHDYMPLANLAPDQGPIEIYNSPLSENSVLGFEYGYSLDTPDGLTIWEAQFGDFANVAQPIIDQFITSAEDKWNRLSGLVMLLPHGFEGMGPEHSSARLERFLMLSAEDNIQVVNPTTPAQYFHLLRRQVMRKWLKPLVVMSPKSLLRHPGAVSELSELTAGTFQRVIPDAHAGEKRNIKRVLLCCGKVYYDLIERREALHREDVAIVRIEQLYPFPQKQLEAVLGAYGDDMEVIWVQEEPRNQGAWPFLRMRFCPKLLGRYPLKGIARRESASPATGSRNAHMIEQENILTEAIGAKPIEAPTG
ncbi:MAG: 2-oxoglutarate dehydrogenase E1 component [Phycisphaerales bacterium]